MPKWTHARRFHLLAGLALVLSASAASAGENKVAVDAEPTFGSRTDKPDGSAALTIGRRLPTEWETKIGTDVSLAAPADSAASEILLRGGEARRSSGVVWGNLTMPGVRQLGFDKTAVEARLDAGKDEGKLGATLSRSVPINQDLSVTLQNSYSVRQSLATGAPAPSGVPYTTAPAGAAAAAGPVPDWAVEQSLRLNLNPSGTTFSAGAGSSTADPQWHNKLSVEQTLIGPLKLTTSVEDAGTTASKKSIIAGFKKVW